MTESYNRHLAGATNTADLAVESDCRRHETRRRWMAEDGQGRGTVTGIVEKEGRGGGAVARWCVVGYRNKYLVLGFVS